MSRVFESDDRALLPAPDPAHGLATASASSTTLRTVLVVDDQSVNRIVLKTMLEKDGFRVILANDGREAVEAYKRERPDLVLMDVMMPVMDGYEATRQIKALANGNFVPVIFLTAVTDEHALAKCVECGGDDFLTKPYSRVILRAKMDALCRVRRLYDVVRSQRDEIERHHERLRQEHELAERLFSAIVGSTGFDVPNIQYLISPMTIASGDLVLAERRPDGVQQVLVGDFTGHGLSAALGALPVADTFQAMTRKGFGVGDIVDEINRKLYDKAPTGYFLAACLLEFDPGCRTVRVWNGGLPEVLVVGTHGGVRSRANSEHLPLGVVPGTQMDGAPVLLDISAGDRIYIYTDGVVEAVNAAGDMFGLERLEATIERNEVRGDLFEELVAELEAFQGDAEQSDDVTLVEIDCDAARVVNMTTERAIRV